VRRARRQPTCWLAGSKALLLLNTEPAHDTAAGAQAHTHLAGTDMVVTLSPFKANLDISDVLLPIAPFTETPGTFVNAEGRVQGFHAVVKPFGETRPAWKVLRVLANLLGLPGFDFESSRTCWPKCSSATARCQPTSTPSTWATARRPLWISVRRRHHRLSHPSTSSMGWCAGPLPCNARRTPALPPQASRPPRARMIDALYNAGLGLLAASWWTGVVWPVVWTLMKIVVVVLPLMGAVAYLTLWERKFMGWMQVRVGPNRVGPLGLLQPIADALKLLTKEILVPAAANKGLFFIGSNPHHHAGLGGLGRGALWPGCGLGQRQCRPVVCDGHYLAWRCMAW